MKLKQPKCSKCVYWHYDDLLSTGQCRYDSPGKSAKGTFPVVGKNMWCGHFVGWRKNHYGNFYIETYLSALNELNSTVQGVGPGRKDQLSEQQS